MSKNCINCITETRNGPDLLCDHCRNRIRVIKDEKGRPCLIVGGKEHTMDRDSMMELIKEASESVDYDAHVELARVRSKCVAPALFQLEKIRTEKLACTNCGAPNCCPKCCLVSCEEQRNHLDEIKQKAGDCNLCGGAVYHREGMPGEYGHECKLQHLK